MAIERVTPTRGIKTKYEASSSDDAVKIGIADLEGCVVVFFNKRINWFELPKATMVAFACSLLRRAGVEFTIGEEGKAA